MFLTNMCFERFCLVRFKIASLERTTVIRQIERRILRCDSHPMWQRGFLPKLFSQGFQHHVTVGSWVRISVCSLPCPQNVLIECKGGVPCIISFGVVPREILFRRRLLSAQPFSRWVHGPSQQPFTCCFAGGATTVAASSRLLPVPPIACHNIGHLHRLRPCGHANFFLPIRVADRHS